MSLFMMLFGGIFGGGAWGLPPGERDAAFVQCPPKDVILYSEWASRGQGKPGAPGIDGLAADPEVLAFIEAIDKGIRTSIELNAANPGEDKEEIVFGQTLPPLIKLLLNRSGCLYVDVNPQAALKLMANPPELPRFTPPFVAMLPALKATVIFNGGDEADAIAKHLQTLIDLMPPDWQKEGLQQQKFPIPLEGADLTLHRHEKYFIVGWGEDTVDAALKGLTGKSQGLKDNPPFQASMKKVTLERTGSVAWFNLDSLVKKIVGGLGPQGLVVAAMLQTLGADTIESVALCTGVVDGQIHSRGFVKTSGKTEGILALAAGRPLKPSDFAHVPGDADLVLGFSLNAAKVLESAQKIVGQADPQSKLVFDQVIAELEKELGLSFKDDVFQAFGEAWVLYDSPSNGGVLFTSPVLGLEVKDPAKAKVAFEKLMGVLKLALPGEIRAGRFGRAVHLSKKSFMEHEVYYVNSIGDDDVPFAPSFTLTKNQLLVALHPQPLKGHLRFLESKQDRFEATMNEKIKPEAGELFALCYTQPELFARYLVALSPYVGQVIFSHVQREMPALDIFELPSARAILPYLGTGLLTKERTEDGILWNNRHGLPIPGASATLLILPATFGYAVFRVERQMVPPQAVPAIQINQHQPKRPAQRKPLPPINQPTRATAS